ncbi:MAG: cyanoexosortase B system-associated protein [Synechococcales bacterium]|nr:cyanoexosortase B system-associated protein [Synechococcales bacterium]
MEAIQTVLASLSRSSLVRRLLPVGLLAIAAIIITPNYITGAWAWEQPPQTAILSQIRALRDTGLDLPDWQTLEQKTTEIGGHQWSVQAIAPSDGSLPDSDRISPQRPVYLFLRPQADHADQPQVEWVDINGAYDWTTDRLRRIEFSGFASSPTATSSHSVIARYLRGWNLDQTFAVVQWYAWKTGGSASTLDWFLADQAIQWRDRQRQPWVAVSLLIPIEPLGDIEQSRSLAATLGQTVQASLVEQAFTPVATSGEP